MSAPDKKARELKAAIASLEAQLAESPGPRFA